VLDKPRARCFRPFAIVDAELRENREDPSLEAERDASAVSGSAISQADTEARTEVVVMMVERCGGDGTAGGVDREEQLVGSMIASSPSRVTSSPACLTSDRRCASTWSRVPRTMISRIVKSQSRSSET